MSNQVVYMRQYMRERKALLNSRIPVDMKDHVPFAWEYFCRYRPSGYDIDHIIPLQTTEISGLHTPMNWRYLPSTVNKRKGIRVFASNDEFYSFVAREFDVEQFHDVLFGHGMTLEILVRIYNIWVCEHNLPNRDKLIHEGHRLMSISRREANRMYDEAYHSGRIISLMEHL